MTGGRFAAFIAGVSVGAVLSTLGWAALYYVEEYRALRRSR